MSKIIKKRKKTKFAFIGIAVLVVMLGAGLMIMSVLHNGEASATDTEVEETVDVEAISMDDTGDYSKQLFACKIENVNDTAAIVALMDTIKMEEIAGEYTVTIEAEGDAQVLSINLTKPVQENDKKTFDGNMQKCAEQMLALIPGVSKVTWTYSVISEEVKEEVVTVSLDEAGANKDLRKDVRAYGNSAKKLQKMLEEQNDR